MTIALPAGLNPHATHTLVVPCDKCNGKGTIAAFAHIDGGICYQCEGETTMEVTIVPPEHGPWLPPPPERKGKFVSLPSMPGALITRAPWGSLRIETESEYGYLHTHFGVSGAGRVFIETMCEGHISMVCAAADFGDLDTPWRERSRFARTTLRTELQAAYDARSR